VKVARERGLVLASHVLKIFGERNTGTRALARTVATLPGVTRRIGTLPRLTPEQDVVMAIVQAKIPGRWRNLYRGAIRDDAFTRGAPDDLWKHAVPRLTPGAIKVGAATLIMVRNPYSWALSLCKRPYHQVGPRVEDFAEFITLPWMTERREGTPAVLGSPVDLWSVKVRGSLAYQAEAREKGLGCEVIRFEDFVQDPQTVTAAALEKLGLPTAPLVNVQKNTKRKGLSVEKLRRRYAEEAWRADLTPETVATVTERIDWDLANKLGYTKIAPEEVGTSDGEAGAAATA